MKLRVLTVATAALGLAALGVSAHAEEGFSPKGPPKTMGDEGKLPATGTGSGQVRDMRSPDGATPAEGTTSGPVTAKGPPKRMGDEGVLPSTSTMDKSVPEMR